jgi:hypothetical protein
MGVPVHRRLAQLKDLVRGAWCVLATRHAPLSKI